MSDSRQGRLGHKPRKRFGQNFLRDQSVIDAIAQAINPQPGDHLVEIGPGEGALTQALISTECAYDAIELDRDLTAVLLASFSIYSNFALHSADALNFDFSQLRVSEEKLRVVGNLPYNISTPLIFKLLENIDIIRDMHFMLQLEVVQRLSAAPGSKHWGRVGVMAQYLCQVTHLIDVPPESFYPAPKVQSAVVSLRPHHSSPYKACDPVALRTVTRHAFAQRRKTLRNNFKGIIDDSALEALGIDPNARAESLALADFVSLASLM
ncbi:dimethyladenosine transferase [Luminiphilus syltensis NOR5-1B]|uniref:Ribosomal RNA small subunit methyltransferase A n=1 Tax=Luminiphilus syltensis NOR5-1B TaxID=565045 RepID=B8KVX9_9GAMM|nr:16S rRNA (adenine(1518)-N(6)/adenine(1519)-N(6))-dimethyltransferase RsmA [Luminiphilus syltensis]EED36266.1 dimethyladenosine transferase [Luminiphilus syltensis NOR5-1B]